MRRPVIWFWLYAAAAAADLFFVINGSDSNRLISKPILMPLLMLAWISATGLSAKNSLVFFGALFFSWLGDIFLMFDGKSDLFFIGGLSSFLVSHLLYVVFFVRLANKYLYNGGVIRNIRYVLPVAAYIFLLLFLLWPGLGSLKIPVIIYALAIGTMLVCALRLQTMANSFAARMTVAGAILFVVSDSVLALNKFRQPIPLASFFIMLSYILAQGMISAGVISFRVHAHQRAQMS